jgi:hypothetical protein
MCHWIHVDLSIYIYNYRYVPYPFLSFYMSPCCGTSGYHRHVSGCCRRRPWPERPFCSVATCDLLLGLMAGHPDKDPDVFPDNFPAQLQMQWMVAREPQSPFLHAFLHDIEARQTNLATNEVGLRINPFFIRIYLVAPPWLKSGLDLVSPIVLGSRTTSVE